MYGLICFIFPLNLQEELFSYMTNTHIQLTYHNRFHSILLKYNFLIAARRLFGHGKNVVKWK